MPLASSGSLGRLCPLSDFSSFVSVGGMFSPAPSVAELTLCGEEELCSTTTSIAGGGGGRGVDSGSPTGRGGGPALSDFGIDTTLSFEPEGLFPIINYGVVSVGGRAVMGAA